MLGRIDDAACRAPMAPLPVAALAELLCGLRLLPPGWADGVCGEDAGGADG